jgi:hypothetical protein
MTSTESNWKFGSDLPDFVLRKVELLRQQEARIFDLEDELLRLRRQRHELQVELSPYRQPHTPHAAVAPINRCPNEILQLIFEYDVKSDFSRHPSIRRLLLVCRSWLRLIMNSPGLWALIQIQDPWYIFERRTQKSQAAYISACINRSKDAPLKLSLDLQYLPTEAHPPTGIFACSAPQYSVSS